jgi:allantoate deiminase
MTDPAIRKDQSAAKTIIDRLRQLGQISDEPDVLTRTFLSPAMDTATRLVGQWMAEAGLEVTRDDWGNIIGRLASKNSGAKTLLLGSHLDTVRNAGCYDGPLGVLLALAACEEIRRADAALLFHIDVIGFSDEEGVRFQSAYLGSKAIAGLITEEDLKLVDETGEALAQVVGNPLKLPSSRYAAGDLLGYVEAHIEQGPVLEAGGRALGVVTAIAAQSRYSCSFTGRAGHAGTTPMNLRQDALAGAAEFIALVEKVGQETAGLVATVGQIKVQPNVSNVIPESVVLSLDVRHAQSSVVKLMLDRLAREGNLLAERRNLTFSLGVVQSSESVDCDPSLTVALGKAVGKLQPDVPHLVSGAGHDGVILSRIAPIAMLFVRCRNGLSHHPDEYAEPEDIGLALTALTTFIREMA